MTGNEVEFSMDKARNPESPTGLFSVIDDTPLTVEDWERGRWGYRVFDLTQAEFDEQYRPLMQKAPDREAEG